MPFLFPLMKMEALRMFSALAATKYMRSASTWLPLFLCMRKDLEENTPLEWEKIEKDSAKNFTLKNSEDNFQAGKKS